MAHFSVNKAFDRLFPGPLDNTSVFATKKDLDNYVAGFNNNSNGVPYAGQIVYCVEGEDHLFVIEQDEEEGLKLSKIGLTGEKGESAFDVAVRNGFEGTEEEWLESLKPKFEPNFNFSIDIISKEDENGVENKPLAEMTGQYPDFEIKLVLPIGESAQKVEKPQIYYGTIPFEEMGRNQVISGYDQIQEDRILRSSNLKKAGVGPLGRTEIYGHENDYLIVAVPDDKNLVVMKDNGIGGKVKFDESQPGANGTSVIINNMYYDLYGEMLTGDGMIYVYVDER